jgi:hypothetical protein
MARTQTWKVVTLALLLIPCVWLMRRNLFPPDGALSAGSAAGGARAVQNQALQLSQSPRNRAAAERQEQLLNMDPSLRLDLLEASRSVKYQGNSRNIFEYYTPPPPPAPARSSSPKKGTPCRVSTRSTASA